MMEEDFGQSLVRTSLAGSSRNTTRSSSITNTTSTATIEDVQNVITLLNLVQARITFLKGNLEKGNESRRGNMTQMDVTYVNKNCKTNLEQLWKTIEKVNLKSAALKMVVMDSFASELMVRYDNNCSHLSIAGIEDIPRNIVSVATKLATASEAQKEMCKAQEHTLQNYIEKQDAVVKAGGELCEEINREENSQLREEQLNKIKQRVAKTKCARAIINCFLSLMIPPLEQQGQWLELKMKYRNP